MISGCSGGGKSTLQEELGQRGYATVEEPGRRIVKEQLQTEVRRSLGQTEARSPVNGVTASTLALPNISA